MSHDNWRGLTEEELLGEEQYYAELDHDCFAYVTHGVTVSGTGFEYCSRCGDVLMVGGHSSLIAAAGP